MEYLISFYLTIGSGEAATYIYKIKDSGVAGYIHLQNKRCITNENLLYIH